MSSSRAKRLVILTPINVLKRNLNRITFVVWEMKRNEEPIHSEKIGVWCGDVPGAHNWVPSSSMQPSQQLHIYMEIFNTFLINWTMWNSQLDISSWMERHPTLHTTAWPKFSSFPATASFRRDFGHHAHPIWRRLIISYGDIWKGQFTKTNHEPQTPWKQTSLKKFRQLRRTYWQGLPKMWRAGFNPVWTQMVATSSACYDVVACPLEISLQYPH